MKKSISIFMPPARVLLFSLLPSFNNPVIATEQKPQTDTAYYFNERGTLIWQQPHAMQPGCFVIRTSRKFRELYNDFLRSDSVAIHATEPYKPADVQCISRRLARKVEKLVREGRICDPLVMANVLEILDQESLYRMRRSIKGRLGDIHDSGNFREYGGLVKEDGTITSFAGDAGDPRRLEGGMLHIKGSGYAEYHSHPAGYVETADRTAPGMAGNMVAVTGSKSCTGERRYVAYIQGPSSVDQQAVGNRRGYVFGMSSGLIYVYDNEGVKATLPIAFAENRLIRKPAPKVKRADNSSLAVR